MNELHLPMLGTRYGKNIRAPNHNMLKRGKQNSKLGDQVSAKKWHGMTMFSLTLEERTTCPTSCQQWHNCYGNNMPFAHRFDHTHPDFYPNLHEQLRHFNFVHPQGFVVRLHVLGDFFSTSYIARWQSWLIQFENLHVFGYTHHPLNSTEGQMLHNINQHYPERWRIRFSDDTTTSLSAHVIASDKAKPRHGIICPEQTKNTNSCADCGYCWTSEQPINFIAH